MTSMSHRELLANQVMVDIKKQGITDSDIQALVDDELSPDQAARVREHLLHHPRARHRYDSLVKQKQLLQEWWRSRRQ
jgi:anti-sigma factor RsiW